MFGNDAYYGHSCIVRLFCCVLESGHCPTSWIGASIGKGLWHVRVHAGKALRGNQIKIGDKQWHDASDSKNNSRNG